MDVKTLYSLIAIADHGSFGGAATALGVSVSGISLQIKGLEDELGMVLFDRSKRPPPLTEQGLDLVERARILIADWERLSESLKRDGDSGILRLGTVHTVVAGMLPGALGRLRRQAPGLKVRLTTGLTHELEAALAAGRIDAAIVTEPETIAQGASFTPFCTEDLVVIAGPDAVGADFRAVLERNSYVRFNQKARVANRIEAALGACGIIVSSEMEIDTLEGVIALVEAGLGVSIVPERTGTPLPRGLRRLPFGDPPVTRTLGLLQSDGNPRRRFFAPLLEALRASAGSGG